MADHTQKLPNAALYELDSKNWPPPPKVKEYDETGTVKPRQDSPSVADLKRDNAMFLFESMHAGDMVDSISSMESQRPSIHLQHPLPPDLDTAMSFASTLADQSGMMGGKGNESILKTQSNKTTAAGPPPTKGKGKEATEKKRDGLEEVKKPRKKIHTKQFPRMSRLALWDFLNTWDQGANSDRMALLHKFLEDYTSQDPLDLDIYLSKGASLIFTRFIVGMQISFQRKKHVAHHFIALGTFIRSLHAERYVYEFGLAGGFQTSFEVLRIHEMSNHDKMHAFHFLYLIAEGPGGSSAKRFICSDTSYLECVVDCLTMNQDPHVIKEAKRFLQNICIGNTSKNLVMISKYVISLLPCDFNPQIQAMACHVLEGIINQNAEVAAGCCILVVDVLKSNYDDALVDVGNVCLAIMGTSSTNELLVLLIEAAQPFNLLENLTSPVSPVSPLGTPTVSYDFNHSDESPKIGNAGPRETEEEHDPYFRFQYGAIYTLSYLVKNQPKFADGMIERGVIGSLLSGIGTVCYTSVQLEAVRLLLLLHELSPDCSVAISALLPKPLLSALLAEHEEVLQYVTAVMGIVLRRLGCRVQAHWEAWFLRLNSPGGGAEELDTASRTGLSIEIESEESEDKKDSGDEDEEGKEDKIDVLQEIDTLVELLADSLSDPFMTILERMKLIFPDPNLVNNYREDKVRRSHSGGASASRQRFQEKVTPGEEHVQTTEALEPFRKYLRKENLIVEQVDEFEKYYAAKFIMASEDHIVDMDAAQALALKDAELAMASSFKVGESTVDNPKDGDLNMYEDGFDSGQDQMLNL